MIGRKGLSGKSAYLQYNEVFGNERKKYKRIARKEDRYNQNKILKDNLSLIEK